MRDPITAVDVRFSEPGATPTSWPDTRTVLETAELLIEEYARHNGHADLLRERIDGVTGVPDDSGHVVVPPS